GKVVSTNISAKTGTVKQPVPKIELNEIGVKNDSHAGFKNRNVSLLAIESINNFNEKSNTQVKPGDFAENITLSGIDLTKIKLLDRLSVNNTLLEVTQIGKKCHGEGCKIFQQVGKCAMPTEGIFCRVLQQGTIQAGDEVTYTPRMMRVKIITLSDRAHKGEYQDLSGKTAEQQIKEFLQQNYWQQNIITELLPDDKTQLKKSLIAAINNNVNVIFTLGGTGIGSRDITPEVVTEIADKIIPGIMEHIRYKYGATIPSALLSRSIAAIANKTLIYTLPGSVKAVKEYLTEIFTTLEHAIYMLHDLGH
ncbi:MAG: molybdopterin-binding protein, partial [Gammaproteobacteria bacterium]